MTSELSDILPGLISGLTSKPESLLILGADGPAPTADNVVGAFCFAEAGGLEDTDRPGRRRDHAIPEADLDRARIRVVMLGTCSSPMAS